jgi:Phospholipase_D-nuclease N-terminal/zinc-ribbon domain
VSFLGPSLFIGFFFVWISFAVVGTGIWIWMLIDACQRPEWAYAQAGSNKTMWIVLVAVLGFIGALIYLFAIRPKVSRLQEVHEGSSPQWGFSPGGWEPSGYCTRCGVMLQPSAMFCPRCGLARR